MNEGRDWRKVEAGFKYGQKRKRDGTRGGSLGSKEDHQGA